MKSYLLNPKIGRDRTPTQFVDELLCSISINNNDIVMTFI
jgi:hypothetical protein